MLYEGPVLRRLYLQVGVSMLAAFLVAVVIGAIEGSPYTIAIVLGIIAFAGLFVIVHRFTPTRIELEQEEMRLVAPKATTRYRPGDMWLRVNLTQSTFTLGRRDRTRRLAVFRDLDVDRVKQVFGQTGVTVVGP